MKDGRRFGKPPDPFEPPATPVGKINVTDPDSRNVKTPRGYVQGNNAQAAVTEGQIVIAAEVTVDSPDFRDLEAMVIATESELAAIRFAETPQAVVADACYWHQVQMDNVVERGIQVLIRPDAGNAVALGRAGTAACTRSCAASFKAIAARSSTPSTRA